MDEWRLTRLGELGVIVTGKTPPGHLHGTFGGDIPFLTPSDFDGRRVIDSTARYLTESGANTVKGCRLPARAVMVSCIGSDMGKAAMAGRDCFTNQQINSIVVKPENDPFFVYYNLSIRKAEIRSAAGGSAQPIMNKAHFGQLEIFLPPLSEQRTIAEILGALDDKIELNRRMNETLEVIARAIFKSWFVDFDPVRAKMEGRWHRGQSLPGLSADLYHLFPPSFEDSPLGKIPKGWQAGTLADFALLNPESWSRDTHPDTINYIDLSNTKQGRIETRTVYFKDDAPSRAQRILRPRDTIVGTVRPGNASYAFISEDGLTGSTGFAVLRPRRIEYAEFVYLAATAAHNIKALAHLADGGAYPAVRPEAVVSTQIVRMDDEALTRFSALVGPFLAEIAQNERESGTLAKIRDTLLPKLMSGEIRIVETERPSMAAP